MKMITNIVYPALMLIALGCFGISPTAKAVCQESCSGFSTALGEFALSNGGDQDTAVGYEALYHETTGFSNTAVGYSALNDNTTGFANAAIGNFALESNTSGTFNTATGYGALIVNTTGSFNTATGSYALEVNETGNYNTATGINALRRNHTGIANTAVGVDALYVNDQTGTGIGSFNSAFGTLALVSNTDGADNSAFGSLTLVFNTTGGSNTAIGEFALLDNTTGSENTAHGSGALESNTSGSGNIGLGSAAGSNLTTGDNNIDIGNPGQAGESGTIRIGTAGTHTATFAAGIFGSTVTDGVAVIVDTNGHLATQVSSARFKNEIKPMDKASEAILALKPVTFHYKTDTKGTPQFGLIAEEVAKVNPDLVVRDEDGKPYTVRYDQVNAMLLNEFLKEHCKVEAQQATIAELKSTVAQQQNRFVQQKAQIQSLTSCLHKVSAQLEVRNHAVAARNDR